MYELKLNGLICQCAEFCLTTVFSLDPQWQKLLNQTSEFFAYYELASTPEYSLFLQILNPHSYIVAGTKEKELLKILFNLKKYKDTVPKFFDRVFISHSSKDIDVVKPFVNLLRTIGLDRTKLFCSSIDGYGIPQRENIYDFLKREFTEKNTFVVMIMSDNYYDSKPSLNEMGAAWAMSKEYISILIKGFEFSQIEGAVDAQKIGFKIEDAYRLDEFKENLVKELRLPPPQNWETEKERFLSQIRQAKP